MNKERKIFIGNLSPLATPESLRLALSVSTDKGTVSPSTVSIVAKPDGTPKGFAFAQVPEEHLQAFLMLDGSMYHNKPLAVSTAIVDKDSHTKFFIRNIAFSATKTEMKDFLAKNGVNPVNLVLVEKEGKFKGIGFVLVHNADREKLLKMDGLKFKDRAFYVTVYKEKGEA